jgi:NAD(P)-dependent dehydrogenase (short-subunit alcohol dehydrogenase family)
MLLKNECAVISGAATENGIGFATARLFAENGATGALLDLGHNSPQKKALLGEDHRGYVCDVTQKEACTAVAQQILEDFGGVDILINNAGITQPIRA